MSEGLIIAPDKATVKQLRRWRWKAVKYMHAVRNERRPGISNLMNQTIEGRALGEREDGACFWVAIDIPWSVDEKFKWQKAAKKRLDTFLSRTCTCKASEDRVKYCDWHVSFLRDCYEEDRAVNCASEQEARDSHVPQNNQGPILEMRTLHTDFPWVKHDLKRKAICCTICNVIQEPFPENPTHRNIFVRVHSHCGFPSAGYEKSLRETTLRMFGDVERELKKKRSAMNESVMAMDVLLHYCESRGATYLPEVMSLEEAIAFIQKDFEKRGSAVPRLGGQSGTD